MSTTWEGQDQVAHVRLDPGCIRKALFADGDHRRRRVDAGQIEAVLDEAVLDEAVLDENVLDEDVRNRLAAPQPRLRTRARGRSVSIISER
jgi:hypothetical protein